MTAVGTNRLRGARWVVIAGLWVGVMVACSDDGAPAKTEAIDESKAACPKSQQREDGGCCAPGSLYDFAADSCRAVGPRSCPGAVGGDIDSCAPRWCGDWKTDDGAACTAGEADCWLRGRACTDEEIAAKKGCPAGQWPSPHENGACVAVGVGPGVSSKLSGPIDGSPPRPDDKPPRWCWKGTPAADDAESPDLLAPRPCTTQEFRKAAGCPAGTSPVASKEGAIACKKVGARLLCPDGFKVDETAVVAADLPKPCVPDPARCPTTKWGPHSKPGVLHVDATATGPGADGSAAKPYASIGLVGPKLKAGGVILLAPGTYSVPNIDRSLTIRGVCAAKVTLKGLPGAAVVLVQGNGAGKHAHFADVKVTGDGIGLVSAYGWRVTGRHLWVDKTRTFGVAAQLPGSRLELVDSVISNTVGHPSKPDGSAAGALDQSVVVLRNCRLSSNRAYAAGALKNGLLRMDNVLIDEVVPTVVGPGVMALKGGRVQGRHVTVVGATAVAVRSTGAGSDLAMESLAVRATQASNHKISIGHGIDLLSDGKAMIAGAVIDRPISAGAVIAGKGCDMRLGGAVIRDVQVDPNSGEHGYGLKIVGGATVQAHGCHIDKATSEGVALSEDKNSFTATDLLITDTQADKIGRLGLGIGSEDSTVDVQRARLVRNRRHGLWSMGPAARVRLRDVYIADTKPATDANIRPIGLAIGNHAWLRFSNVRLSGNAGHALKIEGGSDALGCGLLSDHPKEAFTQDAEKNLWFYAVNLSVNKGSRTYIAGGRLVGGQIINAAAVDKNTQVHWDGVVVEDTRVEPKFLYGGLGFDVSDHATARVRASVLRNHHTAAVWVSEHARLHIEDSVVATTKPATVARVAKLAKVLADGLLATSGARLEVVRSVVHGHQRAAVFGKSDTAVQADASLFTTSGYGLVCQSTTACVHGTSIVAGNSEASIKKDGSFAVAQPPGIITATK